MVGARTSWVAVAVLVGISVHVGTIFEILRKKFNLPKRWRDDVVGQQGATGTRIAKDRESWRTLAEGYFLQWKDTA